jgi:hypothetical protein
MKFEAGRESKSFCQANPSAGWDICPADGGGLRNFAFPPFFFRTADGEGGPGGNVRADFLWYFLCSATKKVHQSRYSARAQLCAPGYEGVENLATPSSTLYPRAPHPSVRKSCSKYRQIPLKKSIFCPFCRLTYTILYVIMYLVRFFFPNITFFRKRHTLTSMPANQKKGCISPAGTRSRSVPFCFFMRSFSTPLKKEGSST